MSSNAGPIARRWPERKSDEEISRDGAMLIDKLLLAMPLHPNSIQTSTVQNDISTMVTKEERED